MNAKDLERLLASHGANPTGVEMVFRRLREALKVSVSGRGFNAHNLTAYEMTLSTIAYLGSEAPSRAPETLARLSKLKCMDVRPNDFILCFQLVLLRDIKSLGRDIKDLREIRIARNADFAQIIFHDGPPLTFINWRTHGATPPAFRSEGVVSAALIDILADNIVVDDDRSDENVIEAQE